ncbi:RpiR family transcriptional regulator [Roseovarius atlanticus]|uniref:RpiR family transcriptional regulator n=1 Tax=Roseovarius atlanticus TaxID=1641875 RepID=A0A0T5P013_9RHOB|nr:MurR/RpiR family transcriptional regulator [Roseovarius atlanticus]KRS14480.1 RpiR family transcriptional regulator [Roseovarius atlanticus]
MARTVIVKDTLKDMAGALTPAERLLSDTLLRDYPMAGLQSITKLAEAAGVSTPTVIRLARKLGFDGFPEMQAALREEASAQIKKPILKREGWPQGRKDSPAFRNFAEAVFDNLNQTIERLDPATFDALAKVLADTRRSIFLLGGRITRSNADYFFNHLQIVRPGVTLLSQSPNVWPQYLIDMGPRSVLVIFDIRRYEADLARLASLAKERGVVIVLFTDQWGSPISQSADHVINALVEVPSSWDSTLGINLIVEALIAAIQTRRQEKARDRIEELEDMFRSTRIFRK